jgi:hypothetical protein
MIRYFNEQTVLKTTFFPNCLGWFTLSLAHASVNKTLENEKDDYDKPLYLKSTIDRLAIEHGTIRSPPTLREIYIRYSF